MLLNLDLKNRKRINNGLLPKFYGGTESLGGVNVAPTNSISNDTNIASNINNRFNNLFGGSQGEGNKLSQTINKGLKDGNYYGPGSTWQQNSMSGADNAATGAGPWMAAGAWLGGGVLEGLQSIKDKDTLMAESSKYIDNIGGIEYELYNIDTGDELMHDYDRSTKLDSLINPTRAITKWFGRSKQKEEVQAAEIKKQLINAFNKSEAEGKLLYRNYYKDHGWINSLKMHAFDGKEPALPKFDLGIQGKNTYTPNIKNVYTAQGKRPDIPNANTSKGEQIWDGVNDPQEVTSGPNDTALTRLNAEDTVFTNNPEIPAPWGFKTIAKAVPYATATGLLPQLRQWQANVKQDMKIDKTGKIKAANGYVPAWPNYVSSAIGAAASLGQILDASSLKVHNTDVYAPDDSDYWMNEYNKLDIPWYPVLSNLLRNRAMNTRVIDYSNLAGPVKTLAKMNNIYSYYTNLSNAWNDFVSKRIGLKSDMFKTGISATQNKAARQQAANISNINYNAAGPVAKHSGVQIGLKNLIGVSSNFASDEAKRLQANATLGLYNQNLTNSLIQTLAQYAKLTPEEIKKLLYS